VTYDIRALRDKQVPDENGNVLPPEATRGHFKWSVILGEEDDEQLVMIGRAEHFDAAHAMSSSYACASCCPDSTVDSYVTPFFTVEVFADDIVDFDAVEIKEDCYGDRYDSIRTFNVSWNSSDSEVTSVNSSGTVTALNGGESDIEAVFSGRYYYTQECVPQYRPEAGDATHDIQPNLPGCGACRFDPATQRPRGRLRVKPRITSITPARGLIGTATAVTIRGRSFGSNPSVIIGGMGVTYSGSGGSTTQLTGTLNVAADATIGDHSVQVSNKGQRSNAVNFIVQLPTRLVPFDIPDRTTNGKGPVVVIDNGDIVDLSGNVRATNQCGVYQNVAYVLVDQAGQRIVQPYTLIEEFAFNAQPSQTFNLPANAIITDIHSRSRTAPACLGFNEHDELVQGFTVVAGTSRFDLTTLVSIRVGDFMGTRNVFVEISRP